jgi:hypothetical protein
VTGRICLSVQPDYRLGIRICDLVHSLHQLDEPAELTSLRLAEREPRYLFVGRLHGVGNPGVQLNQRADPLRRNPASVSSWLAFGAIIGEIFNPTRYNRGNGHDLFDPNIQETVQ